MRLYCLRLSERMLVLGGGAVTTSQRYEDDPVILTIIGELKDIEAQIKRIVNQIDTDPDDFVYVAPRLALVVVYFVARCRGHA